MPLHPTQSNGSYCPLCLRLLLNCLVFEICENFILGVKSLVGVYVKIGEILQVGQACDLS